MKQGLLLIALFISSLLPLHGQKWHQIKDSTYNILFPAKPLRQSSESLDEGGIITERFIFRDYRMNYLFSVRTFPKKKNDAEAITSNLLIREVSEMAIAVNYQFKNQNLIQSAFHYFHPIKGKEGEAMEAKYFAKSSHEKISMKIQAHFYKNQLFVIAVFSKGDRLFDLNKSDKFIDSFKIIKNPLRAEEKN